MGGYLLERTHNERHAADRDPEARARCDGPHMNYLVHLDVFEGPFDLLLHLIERAELDIYDIPIARITGEFLDYLQTMQMLNLHVASDFLVVAATLMQIKARMLLPRPTAPGSEETELDEDPRRELVDKLLEYKRFKELAQELRMREEEAALLFARPPGEEERVVTSTVDPLKGLTIWDLLEAFKNVLDAQGPDEEPPAIPREEISIRQRMNEIITRIRTFGRVRFNDVFGPESSRVAVITGFMALLELMKLRRVRAAQDQTFGEIWLTSGSEGGAGLEPDTGQSGD